MISRSHDAFLEDGPPPRRWTHVLTAVFLAALLLVAYAAVCSFWQYLSVGTWMGFRLGTFRDSLLTPLGNLFQRPMSIFRYPWMILVFGGVLAGMVFVPISVSSRRSVAGGLVLTGVMLLTGQALALALAIAAGCVVAALIRRVGEFHVFAIAGGILPPVVFLAFSGLLAVDSAAMLPVQRWLLTLPLLVAVVGAVLGSAFSALLGGVPGLRRSAEVFVLAGLVAGPAGLFFLRIGADELEYCRLVAGVAPGDAVFEPAAVETWHRRQGTEGLTDQALIREPRDRLIERINRFLAGYPSSDRKPDLLWVKGQLRSLQVDRRALRAGRVKPSAAHVLPAARPVWEQLSSYGAAAQAALAHWRLGELDLRAAKPLDAYERLKDQAEILLADHVQQIEESSAVAASPILRKPDSRPSPEYYRDALFATRRLIWLVENNAALEDPNAAAALAAFLEVNPAMTPDVRTLAAQAERYRNTPMGGNWTVVVAKAQPDMYERARMLLGVAENWRDDPDAAIVANYELGILAMSEPVLRMFEGMESAEVYFRRVQDGPVNPWRDVATRRLEVLESLKE